MNKYTFRRFVVAVLFTPVVIAGYWLVWTLTIAFGATGNPESFVRNAWTLGIIGILAFTFYPQLRSFINRIIEPKE